jgi:cobalt-zinc-cadmium efflux system outer membrane protein
MSPSKLAWLLVWSAAAAVPVQAAPLTFDQALARAAETAPGLKSATLKADAARSSGRAAGSLPDPKLSLGLDNVPISGPMAGRFADDEMTMASVGVMQDVPSGAARRAEAGRARAEVGVADAQALAAARDVRLATALAWVDLYYARARLAALEDIEAALRPVLDASPAAVAQGARPAETVDPAEWLVALADRRSALQADVARARAALVRWTGDSDADVNGAPPAWVVDPVVLRAGLDRHPSLMVLDAGVRLADADVDSARAARSSDWSWELAYQKRDDRFGDMVSARVTLSLPIRQAQRQGRLVEARGADATRARADREAARRELLAALETDLADHRMHHEVWMRARDSRLPLAQRRADLETASYGAGSTGLPAVLTAFTGLADARLDVLDKEAATMRDAVRINITYGTDAP